MKTIFFAKFPPPHTGMTIATKTLKELAEEDGRVKIDCISTSYGRKRPGKVMPGWLRKGIVYPTQLPKIYYDLWRRVRGKHYDTFYTVASPSILGHWRNRIAIEIVRPHVRQVVAHIHNGNYPKVFKQPATSGSAKHMVDLVDTFTPSNDTVSELMGRHVPETKRRVVHSTIDQEIRCTEEEVEKSVSKKRQAPLRVMYLSHMIETKGYHDVARAVELVNGKDGEVATADFIGDWPSLNARDRFEREVNQYTQSEAIRIHGLVTDRARIRRMMLDADVFVLPTYYPEEAQPVSIIEAFNAATPVISTRHASIPEYVFDDENGYLVDKKSPRQIAERIRDLSEPSNWREKARAARKTYEEMFSPDAVREQLIGALMDKS